jgi:hypothetical protein
VTKAPLPVVEINREAISKTTIAWFDKHRGLFAACSPLYEREVGHGETEREAIKDYGDKVKLAYLDYIESKKREGRGRPGKGLVSFHPLITSETKERIDALAEKLGISKGEVLAYLAFRYEKLG